MDYIDYEQHPQATFLTKILRVCHKCGYYESESYAYQQVNEEQKKEN